MREVTLSNGMVALVDDEDYELVAGSVWHYALRRNTGYACKNVKKADGKWTQVLMHRALTNFGRAHIDHVDGNGLNNQKSNLRAATVSQNSANARKRRHKTSSPYKGVCWDKHKGKWMAYIQASGARRFVGYFDTDLEAAQAYNRAAVAASGEYAKTNDV